MLIFKTVKHLQHFLQRQTNVGFVPTMGALHSGHLSLIGESKQRCTITVCSIFVNPTQFNDPKDFEKYPVTVSRDIELLTAKGCDVLFLPSVLEMYPRGTALKKRYSFGHIADVLEGEFRPGHFDGMAQVVERLLRIVRPQHIFMGQKDYQQQLIVGKLIQQIGMKTHLYRCAIVREKDGLAMSSRNVRLNSEARAMAPHLYKTIRKVSAAVGAKPIEAAIASGMDYLQKQHGIETEYMAVLNADTLQPIQKPSEPKVVLIAARVGGIRLIDNYLF